MMAEVRPINIYSKRLGQAVCILRIPVQLPKRIRRISQIVYGIGQVISPVNIACCCVISGIPFNDSDVEPQKSPHTRHNHSHLAEVDDGRLGGGIVKLRSYSKHSKAKRRIVATAMNLTTEKRSILSGLQRYNKLIQHRPSASEKAEIALVGEYLRTVRSRFGFTREQLAAKLGVAVEVVVIIENGDGNSAMAQHVYHEAAQLRRQLS